MDLPWGDERTQQFITNVGLITSTGSNGDNVMACEWTHHVSYSPGLIMVCIGPGKATYENIKETREFGVNICSTDQTVLSSIAGGNSGKNVDKIAILKELGFKFYPGKKIKSLMIDGTALSVECKVIKVIELGDHTMFIGEVVEASREYNKEPLAYHKGKYWRLTENIPKSVEKEVERIKQIIEKHKKIRTSF